MKIAAILPESVTKTRDFAIQSAKNYFSESAVMTGIKLEPVVEIAQKIERTPYFSPSTPITLPNAKLAQVIDYKF